jgi:DNA-binding NtrC family response regulator
MATKKPVILITDDEKSIRNSLREILEFENYDVLEAVNGKQTIDIIAKNKVDLLLLDIKMKGMDGMEVLEKLMSKYPNFPVIMISGHGNIPVAVEATKKGAFDFISKPPDLNRLLVSIKNALKHYALAEENRVMRSRMPRTTPIIGESNAMKSIKNTIDKVAPTNSRVLITGENGTGKELVARWIHEKSNYNKAIFVAVNCAAIPSELLESELFGHEKGAFTGATQSRIGKFEQADGGTLFLDEIGDMSPDAQSKVLRALQENSITRLGGVEKKEINVRILAATNQDLDEKIKDGSFREDLLHRINVIPIHIPPLRERRDDIPLLAKNYLEYLAQKDIVFSNIEFTNEALDVLKKQEWSGNVRELQNMVERIGVLNDASNIQKKDVEKLISTSRNLNGSLELAIEEEDTFQQFKERAERVYLIKKLQEYDWNISQTAKAIGIQRSHIYNKINKYEIEG